MRKEERLTCPFSLSTGLDKFEPCLEDDCAWWQVDKCIVFTIAQALEGFAHLLREMAPRPSP